MLDEIRYTIQSLMQLEEPAEKTPSVEKVSDNRIEQLLAQALTKYGAELASVRWWARLRNERAFFPEMGMYDWVEAQILYLLIRSVKPESVVEISPNFGYSTGFILLAMNKNNHGTLYSFDLEEKFHQRALQNLQRVGIDPSRQRFHAGDIRENYRRAVPDKIDLLFMDSNHSSAFALWYIAHLYPRVADGGLIHAHDVLKYGVRPHLGDEGEGKAIWDFVQRMVSVTDSLYVSEFVREQPIKQAVFRQLKRYPFAESLIGTNNVEQSASLWIIKRF